MAIAAKSGLTLGPNLFKWQPEVWRDFYLRMADEAPLDSVCLGEVVCDKRSSFVQPFMDEVVQRLQAAGKEVVFSTLALVMNRAERKAVAQTVAREGALVEVNDISAYSHFPVGAKIPHVVGPMINCYNEETLEYFARLKARRLCPPVELPLSTLEILADRARRLQIELEVMAFGRMPLAVSARCYHARAHRLGKDSCRFVCGQDPDGLDLQTLDRENFLTINGIQTLSHGYLNLLNDIDSLSRVGIGRFRLSPHSCDMVEVARLFRAVLDGELDGEEATSRLIRQNPDMPFSNGYLHGRPGVSWTVNAGSEVF